ncbi:TIGR03067 domain-containing protein [Singulisphaera acidiphila]|uniref:Lipocalin-like domain-containing protein n=1 Tax=Singulisphaera acidiphila (strain ATCC BAA-1392 / DSM 18658 / VKM B-2454 / MOB10) TaxID=886293 RepID=L0DRB3_SINAD|nr:TIGR03067 domain-containing protein [Singulisphaera acidiphila]AGA31545.1 hypothetical protein Sinac_7512 [Singulisphaera acidiphila DSM 18658]
MRRLFFFATFAMAVSPCLVRAADLDSIQGNWICITRYQNNKKVDLSGKNATALFERNHLTISESGNPILHCLVTLDESRSPKKAINTWNLDGKDRDQTFPGIYKLDEKAGVLEICIGTKGKRPTTFISEDGSGDIFLKYKRGQ